MNFVKIVDIEECIKMDSFINRLHSIESLSLYQNSSNDITNALIHRIQSNKMIHDQRKASYAFTDLSLSRSEISSQSLNDLLSNLPELRLFNFFDYFEINPSMTAYKRLTDDHLTSLARNSQRLTKLFINFSYITDEGLAAFHQHQFTSIKFHNLFKVTGLGIQSCLASSGTSLEELMITNIWIDNEDIISIVSRCINLRSIIADSVRLRTVNSDLFLALAKNCPKLEVCKLSSFPSNDSFESCIDLLLRGCPSLRILLLNGINKLSSLATR